MSGALPHAIRTARVPARLADGPRLRQGLERWLAEADPARHGLPGDAIVLVRRLAMRWSAVQAGDSATRYAPLAALLAGARRAASADDDADAVWFADEAELLACLARDTLAGLLQRRWWWRAVAQAPRGGRWTPASPQPAQALSRWLQAPQLMPRALQRLGPPRAEAWLDSLGTDGLRHAVTALSGAYLLADEVHAWVLDGQAPPPSDGPSPPRPATAATAAATPPAAAAERLLRLCAALLADAMAAASQAALWRLAERPGPAASAATGRAAEDAPRPGTDLARPLPGGATEAPAAGKLARPTAAPNPPTTTPWPTRDGASKTPEQGKGYDKGPASLRASTPSPGRGDAPPPAKRAALVAGEGRQAQPLELDAPLPSWLDSRHGGLLFLLNAALALSLYGDFTQPRHRGLACPPWRLLLLAGQAWAGPGWRRDPLRRRLIERSAGSHEPLPLALWPQLHARLAAALGDRDGLSARLQIRRMLALPARLQDQGERLDVFYPLARLPLAVRLAGLDRDPGWMPAAGCDIRFHFD